LKILKNSAVVSQDIYEKPIHAVLILFAGNDDEEQRFLKKHAK